MFNTDTLIDNRYHGWKISTFLYVVLFIAFVIDVMNVPILWSPHHFSFVPLILFICAVRFPLVTPYSLAFILGLMTDVFSYAPLGLFSGIYFFTAFIGRWQSRFVLAQPFYVIWGFFSAYWAISLFLTWLGFGLYSRFVFEVTPVIYQFVYGTILFPVLWGGLILVRRLLSDVTEGIA
tara:strand:+ start:416 stop:949 length:534 start_codon:yes stop_codon:yes gene_type:complete